MFIKTLKYISLIITTAISCQVLSNNLQISDVVIYSHDPITHSYKIKFNISWENSWRIDTGANNWDAAWIFIKFRNGKFGLWQHATLSTNLTDCSPAVGSDIDVAADGKGAFIYRDSIGNGNNNFNDVILQWNYSVDGITEDDSIQVKVFGIEMVYVTQGSFFAGNTNPMTGDFTQGSNDNDPWYIDSEDELIVTSDTGSGQGVGLTNYEYYYNKYFDNIDEDSTGSAFTIPASFPKGFGAFYCMKYEISMGQYVDFLNMLTRQQQNTRTETDISTDIILNNFVLTNTNFAINRNTVSCQQTNNGTVQPIVFSTFSPERACNYLSWQDIAAILDWSALRPMSELEYEKACRGTLIPSPDEMAWGNKLLSGNQYILLNNDSTNELVSNMDINYGNALTIYTCTYINGPVRCGIFSGSTLNNSRQDCGATYYGIMEMTGNIEERIISVGNIAGRNFSSINGDGALDFNGNANTLSWPNLSAVGTGFRGGSWASGNIYTPVSSRARATSTSSGRNNTDGGRGVRTVN